MKKRLLSLTAGAALAMGIVSGIPAAADTVPAQPASEWPKECSFGKFKDTYNGTGTEATCKSGGGVFKATVQCKPMNGGPIVERWAPFWQTVGKYSYVYCPPMTTYSSSGIMKKAG